MDIKQLKGEGLSIRAIARETGFSRNTVRRTLRERAPKAYHTPEQASCLDPFKAYIDKRYRKFSLSAVRIIEEIQPMGYEGSIRTLRRYMQPCARSPMPFGRRPSGSKPRLAPKRRRTGRRAVTS